MSIATIDPVASQALKITQRAMIGAATDAEWSQKSVAFVFDLKHHSTLIFNVVNIGSYLLQIYCI